jgi:hypothetical protein
MLRALGTVAVAIGMMDAVVFPPAWARREAVAIVPALARWESAEDLAVREGVPVAREDVLREEADAPGAEAHGSWGEAVDVCAVQAGVVAFRFGEHGGRCARELSPQAYFAARGLLSPFAFATEWEAAIRC